MKEKTLTFNNASLIWWFITWRSALVFFAVQLVVWVAAGFTGTGTIATAVYDITSLLAMVFAQVYFIKLAVNRDFTSKASGSFRLCATDTPEAGSQTDVQSFAPQMPQTPQPPLTNIPTAQ